MAAKQVPSPQEIPSTETQNQSQAAESSELITAELSQRASTTTIVLQEILAQGDDRHYTRHWGINE